MELNEYQKLAMKTAIYKNIGHNLTYPVLGLAGEAGEVCNKYKKLDRDDNGIMTEDRRVKLLHELGGVLWYLAACAEELNSTLERVAIMNLEELAMRQRANNLKGDGDTRGADALSSKDSE
jgi:NTP pyrophosphatase (non-canonical NTP hydrolase)